MDKKEPTHLAENDAATTLMATALTRFTGSMIRLERIADAMECLCENLTALTKTIEDGILRLSATTYPIDGWCGCLHKDCPGYALRQGTPNTPVGRRVTNDEKNHA